MGTRQQDTIFESKDYNGKLHSYNGKYAKAFKSGYKAWFNHGLFHRLDGPAVIRATGVVEWWVNGIPLTIDDFKHEYVGHSPGRSYSYKRL